MVEIQKFIDWADNQDYYLFSGCVEEKYSAIQMGSLQIGKLLNHRLHTYTDQSCCSGPLTKMGFGNNCTLGNFTTGNTNLRQYRERIMLTSCNGCYSYMIKSKKFSTDVTQYMSGLTESDDKIGANSELSKYPPMFLMHIIEYFASNIEKLTPFLQHNAEGITFSFQYGCHYLNQYELSKQDSFRVKYHKEKEKIEWQYNSVPTYLQNILKITGGEHVEYSEALLCCGGSTPQRQINIDNALSIAEKKFDSIHIAKPDVILTICPLCMYFMEDSQKYDRLKNKYDAPVPILHISEFLGLLVGTEGIEEEIKKTHTIDVSEIVDRILQT